MYRRNTGGAVIDGVELFARYNIYDLSLGLGYTHQKVKYKDRVTTVSRGQTSYLTSNIIGYRDQGDKYTLNAEYAWQRFDLLFGYNLLFFKSKKTDSADSITGDGVKMPSYAVNDFYVTYVPNSGRFKGLEVNAGLYNAFNRTYASHSQRTAAYTGDSNYIDWEPGRNFKVSVSYKF